MEIVGEPDLRAPEEAPAYLRGLRQTLIYLGVNDGNMEQGSLRCDANISLRPVGTTELGAKVEVKNMNSFRSIQGALEFEVRRQTERLEQGGVVAQETRGWSELEQVTVSQRSKEEAQEYRYFPEPDLPPLMISREMVAELRADLPELPMAKRARLQSQYWLAPEQARIISERPADAAYFEAVVAAGAQPRTAANWQSQNLQALCNLAHIEVSQSKVSPEALAGLLKLVDSDEVSGPVAKDLLTEAFQSGARPADLMRERGLSQSSDSEEIAALVDAALASQPQAASDYRAGNARALDRLVGAVMGMSKGKANPKLVSQLLRERLSR